ncbi:MAG: hypothetical protein QM528_08565 [Phycisphaerales bacterium]|nr:hypothetical protein [Phycisphaerales bacterium]
MITIKHIVGTPSEEGHCKTRRTKWLSKMVKANISRDEAHTFRYRTKIKKV